MPTATCRQFEQGNQQQQQQQEQLLHLHRGGSTVLAPLYGGGTAQRLASAVPHLPRLPLEMSSASASASGKSTTEAQTLSLKLHSEAERRRRERINSHLATLRRMIPDARQMDKATLLARVVYQLKDLNKRAAETTQQPLAVIPAEANEGIAVDCYTGTAVATGYGRPPPAATCIYVRASVSCDDRPGLHADLAGAFRAMRLRPLRADMVSLGGRAQCDFLLCREMGEEGGGGGDDVMGGRMKAVEEGVRQALAKVAFPETSTTYGCNARTRSRRRQRLLGVGSHSQSHHVLLAHALDPCMSVSMDVDGSFFR